MTITLKSLGIAWRKAKVDLYYSTQPQLLAMAEYEHNLLENLRNLKRKINAEDERWIENSEFFGDWTLAPKAIIPTTQAEEIRTPNSTLIFASPDDEWISMTGSNKPVYAEFRLMSHCSLDFHVLSALWMMRVGGSFDKALGDNIYGNRLRRNRHHKINRMALGSFKPYLKPFREWRDGGISAMKASLGENKKVLALTADVSSFYHELNPDFMLDEHFHERANIKLNDTQNKINRLFIKAIRAWSNNTPLKRGLPVGLPASAVVANAALLQLDQFIEQQVVPLYYGRYVDDILLVMENTSNIRTNQEFWKWIFDRAPNTNPLKKEKDSIIFEPSYLKDSRIAFENSKNKLFVLSGEPGIALVNAISEQINQRASEWRALPNLPSEPSTVATDLLKATSHAGEHADNLRKADALTMHRAGFAINLRDYEAYERDLHPQAWQAHRHTFFNAIIDHLLKPIKFFELAQYLPRIVRMATACEDFDHLGYLIKALDSLVITIEKDCRIKIKSQPQETDSDEAIERWQFSLGSSLYENIVSAFPCTLSRKGAAAWERLIEKLRLSSRILSRFLSDKLDDTDDVRKTYSFLFSHDLAHTPLRFANLPKEMLSPRGIPKPEEVEIINPKKIVHSKILAGIQILAQWLEFEEKIPPGMIFATRPFNLTELYLVAPSPFLATEIIKLGKVIWALRGFELKEHRMPIQEAESAPLHIPDGLPKTKQTIAVSSWETLDVSFVAAATGKVDPDSRRRYQRLNRLISELISRPDGAGYVVLPELSLPPQWFMRIAEKLKARGISLIAGVEYLHDGKLVRNQIWASLTHDGLGFSSLLFYRQDKQLPAFHEEQELFRLAEARMEPMKLWTSPPIIEHGEFRFALLNCSELTNIRYRAALRGKIDALFVTEWNSDTDTFNALVESAALDIHAYIIQCNNRLYGDSRIRAPYKDRWKRDVLRVKGGNHDYCITGEIDVLALRQFQSSHRSPMRDFKPVPDGFNKDMAAERKTLPKGGQS